MCLEGLWEGEEWKVETNLVVETTNFEKSSQTLKNIDHPMVSSTWRPRNSIALPVASPAFIPCIPFFIHSLTQQWAALFWASTALSLGATASSSGDHADSDMAAPAGQSHLESKFCGLCIVIFLASVYIFHILYSVCMYMDLYISFVNKDILIFRLR